MMKIAMKHIPIRNSRTVSQNSPFSNDRRSASHSGLFFSAHEPIMMEQTVYIPSRIHPSGQFNVPAGTKIRIANRMMKTSQRANSETCISSPLIEVIYLLRTGHPNRQHLIKLSGQLQLNGLNTEDRG